MSACVCVCERERRRQSICLIKNYARDSNQALTCEAKPDVSAHRKLFIKCLRFCCSSNAKMKINSHIFLEGKQSPPERLFLAWTLLVLRYCRHLNTPSHRHGEWQRQPTFSGASATFNYTFCLGLSKTNGERRKRKGKQPGRAPVTHPSANAEQLPCPRKHSSGFTLE